MSFIEEKFKGTAGFVKGVLIIVGLFLAVILWDWKCNSSTPGEDNAKKADTTIVVGE